jgi:hypothetical protein
MRTCEIIARLLASGLIEKRETNPAESLFPELERVIAGALGSSAQALLRDAYGRAGIENLSAATHDQVAVALNYFENGAIRAFGANRVRQPMIEARALVDQVFGTL